ncbi:MAG: 50S ribosomal protein L15 [Peptococcaceae bacterium]|jgi:large subunit ribosomal protein L15|nr:50S ribosomal protein L15 [Peptococcaceae bacterium]
MNLAELKPARGARRPPTRKGQGTGSGNGKTAGRGHKGQKARSGGGVRPGFEGGQMPLARRMPKRGFTNHPFKKEIVLVNVRDLNRFTDGSVVDPAALVAEGLVKKLGDGIKILGSGTITRSLTVRANAFSKSAGEKISAAGGKTEVI